MIDNQTLITFFDCMNSRNLDEMGELLADNAELYFPKTKSLIGRDKIYKFFRILFRKYPELSFQVLRTIIQDNSAAVHWTNQGVSKEGVPYNNEGVTIFEEKDEMIQFISDFFKDTERF